jgi:pyruvate,orthophosphate dikinase
MTPLIGDDVLRIVAFKGRTTAEAVGAALGASTETAAAELAALTDAGLLEALPKDGWVKPTDLGRQRVADVYAEERAGCEQHMGDVLDGFHAPNTLFKEVVTAWQLRKVNGADVPNDHTDAAYDGSVLRRLREDVHGAIVPLVDKASSELARLGRYGERLHEALARIEKGEHEYIAHPLKESYHTIWFELHEELIRLAGRDRASEAAAGRA